MLQSGRKLSAGAIPTTIGFLTLAFGASRVFGELRSGLNLIWKVDPKVSSGWRGMLRERFFSLGMVVSVGFVLMVSLFASAALAAMTGFFSSHLHLPAAALGIVDFVVSLAGISLLFGLILKYVPEAPVRRSEVRVGAITTNLLFTAGKLLLGLYLGKTSPGSAYGAAGSLVVMVIWVYYAAQIFYFGAEFTQGVRLDYTDAIAAPSTWAQPGQLEAIASLLGLDGPCRRAFLACPDDYLQRPAAGTDDVALIELPHVSHALDMAWQTYIASEMDTAVHTAAIRKTYQQARISTLHD